MSAQLELDLGRAAAPTRRETPREKALRLTNGTGRMPLDQALDLAMPGWRRTGLKFVDYEPPPSERPPRRKR